MQTAILLFEGLTALDAIGPYEVLSRLPGASVTFVAQAPGPKRTDNGCIALTADAALADLTEPDIVLVPGGIGQRALMDDGPVHEWVRQAHRTSTWTASVCTGSLILAAAGLLDGKRATTHWLSMDQLAALGAQPAHERYVFDGKIATAAGVSAGIDMALALAAKIAGEEVSQAIQLSIEYDPQPPFHAGSPQSAPAGTVELVKRYAGSAPAPRSPRS
jgi:transcriptional regulator GlxA family with amidase domain